MSIVNCSLEERLENALIRGIGDHLEEDLQEALKVYPRAVDIIDGPLMSGMNKVGELFGAGKMFLPQVVKTARTMKKAVAVLQPAIEAEKVASSSSKAGKVLFATVKGDVHDIGKNIVSIVLACNNYEVIDLGVMVPADVIVKKAIEEKPDLVCLSGLITPSLEEMVHVTDEMQKAGLTIPVMVGGATTSKLHTAVKIAPHYDYPVIHVLDASQNPLIAAKLLNPDTRDAYIEGLNKEYEELRASLEKKKEVFVSLAEARANPQPVDWTHYNPVVPRQMGIHVIPHVPLDKVAGYINWVFFFSAWKLSGRFASVASLHECDACRANWLSGVPEEERGKAAEAMQLYLDAAKLLDRLIEMNADYCKAIYGFFPANSDGDNLRVGEVTIPVLRQQTKKEEGVYKSLADYVMPLSEGRTDRRVCRDSRCRRRISEKQVRGRRRHLQFDVAPDVDRPFGRGDGGISARKGPPGILGIFSGRIVFLARPVQSEIPGNPSGCRLSVLAGPTAQLYVGQPARHVADRRQADGKRRDVPDGNCQRSLYRTS